MDRALTDINATRMELAVLVDQENCIAFQGLRCEVCCQVCPIKDVAITLDWQHNERSGKHALFMPVVHSKHCTGCGRCKQACILEEAAIKILLHHLAKVELGQHYWLGWEQQVRSGGPLVNSDPEHKYSLPPAWNTTMPGRARLGKEVPQYPSLRKKIVPVGMQRIAWRCDNSIKNIPRQ